VKSDKDPSVSIKENTTSTTSKIVSISIYNSVTKAKLNTSLCDSIGIKTPLKANATDRQYYEAMRNQSIDIFDPNNPAFTDRCFQYIDNSTGRDTTLNSRIQKYLQNNTIVCSSNSGTNCTYKGIDENGYVDCDCSGKVADDDISNDFINMLSTSYSSLNLDVVKCYHQVFNVI
jgi:hypothetical protein